MWQRIIEFVAALFGRASKTTAGKATTQGAPGPWKPGK